MEVQASTEQPTTESHISEFCSSIWALTMEKRGSLDYTKTWLIMGPNQFICSDNSMTQN